VLCIWHYASDADQHYTNIDSDKTVVSTLASEVCILYVERSRKVLPIIMLYISTYKKFWVLIILYGFNGFLSAASFQRLDNICEAI